MQLPVFRGERPSSEEEISFDWLRAIGRYITLFKVRLEDDPHLNILGILLIIPANCSVLTNRPILSLSQP